ncbi:MAG: argininosuccinate lyase [Truepera sp.]|nr:argininosuccinate lyase [Truepera sp.]
MRWHAAYREKVLLPDYRFASQHLAGYFLDAMLAHVKTVARLPDAHVQARQDEIRALQAALLRLHSEPLPPYAPELPDLYFAINRWLEAELGEAAVSFLRLGLSRNDLDMTVYKLCARELLLLLISYLARLRKLVLKQAAQHLETILIAQSHYQPAQPTTVAHYLSAMLSVLARDSARFWAAYERLDTCPLGAAALAGTSHPLNRTFTAELLGFSAPVANTYDAVASSDWQVELVAAGQTCAINLSRFVCDLLAWTGQGLFWLPDGLVQGSSIMPQKRNPVALEHARTSFSRAVGAAQMVIYSSHNIPYGDLNDFGPDIQGALQMLFVQFDGGLSLLAACLEEGVFRVAALTEAARQSYTTATELSDELTRRYGLSFQEAHRLVARLVARQEVQGRSLQLATPEDLVAVGGPQLTPDELHGALDPYEFIRRRRGLGGPAPEVVDDQLARARQELEHDLARLVEVHSRLRAARERLLAPGKEIPS